MNDSYIQNLVSVIIPTYKRSDMLFRAIDSVCNQTYDNIEILVVNDNVKGDNYWIDFYNKMKKYKNNPKVVIVEQENHINGAAARNAGIRKAKGEFLAFLDDDDWWEPQKIELQIEYISTLDNSWGGVGCLMKHYKDNSLLYVSLPYKEGNIRNEVMTRIIGIGTGSPLLRRLAVDECGYFDEALTRHQDIQFFTIFCDKYKMGLVKKYLYNYDLGDSQNRPSPDRIKEIKLDYYKSVETVIKKLSKKELKSFYILNDFEIGYSYWKAKNKKNGFKLMVRVLLDPRSFYLSLKRIIARFKGKRFKKYYEKKYS